jgi:hypothetical protein
MNKFFIEICDTKVGIQFFVLHEVRVKYYTFYSDCLEIDYDSYVRLKEIPAKDSAYEGSYTKRDILVDLGLQEFML